MTRHELLRERHRRYRLRSNLEIGVDRGRSLALPRPRSIAVAPAFRITEETACDLRLVRAESDDFFARGRELEPPARARPLRSRLGRLRRRATEAR
ncbi:MAG TPA: hypothetical protein VK915_06560 [Gaiellaceae bacterium]|nr:hypothetical protein [Gaiellaceae bacterium]